MLSGIRRILTHRLLFHILSPHLTCRISPEIFRNRRRTSCRFSVERQVFFNPRLVSLVENGGLSELTLALRIFRHQQVPTASVATKHLAGRRHLEAFRHCFLRLASRYRFWHKKPAIYLPDSS